MLELAWRERLTRLGWTLWFITARTLMDFFFKADRRKNSKGEFEDHVLASDYLPSGAWKVTAGRLRSQQPADYVACRAAANKLSAHLTYSRVDAVAAGSPEPSQAVHDYLLGVATVWLNALVPERRVWFGKGLT